MEKIIDIDGFRLRPFTIEDAQDMFYVDSDPRVQRFTGDEIRTSVNRCRETIEKNVLGDYDRNGYGRFAVEDLSRGRVIGFAGLKYLPFKDQTDIGYRFAPEYWGKGLATKLSIASRDFAFNELNLEEIIGIADPRNLASCRVLEKIGLTFDRFDEYDGDGMSHRWYSMKRPT